MDIKTVSDVNLTGRALANGWLHEFSERRRKAVHDLFDVVENSGDEEMRIKAFSALVRADVADLKREEVTLKKQAIDDERRLRLLELIKSLPPGEIARITAEHKATTEGR
jgi:hypothetical protein